MIWPFDHSVMQRLGKKALHQRRTVRLLAHFLRVTPQNVARLLMKYLRYVFTQGEMRICSLFSLFPCPPPTVGGIFCWPAGGKDAEAYFFSAICGSQSGKISRVPFTRHFLYPHAPLADTGAPLLCQEATAATCRLQHHIDQGVSQVASELLSGATVKN